MDTSRGGAEHADPPGVLCYVAVLLQVCHIVLQPSKSCLELKIHVA